MPVRMVAVRDRVYVQSLKKEYKTGELFVTHDAREAEKLERRMKAKPHPETAPDRRFPPAAAAAPAPRRAEGKGTRR
jgi:ABC-type nitrate/sulfonate/bicarbonate transport system ATPase subunit